MNTPTVPEQAPPAGERAPQPLLLQRALVFAQVTLGLAGMVCFGIYVAYLFRV